MRKFEEIAPMKKAVMYGAGNIGRGFIGQLFSQSGYEVVFLDIDDETITRLNRDGSYPLRFVTGDACSEIIVSNVRGVNVKQQDEAVAEIACADFMATAVGAGVLPYIAPVIAKGLAMRWEAGNIRPLNILICENLMDAHTVLRKLLLEQLDTALYPVFDQRVGLVEASIGRMVPTATAAMREGNPTRVWAEPFDELPVDKEGFRGDIPVMAGMKPFSPFSFYIERKLYMHNMSHAVVAYLGNRRGYAAIWQAVRDREISTAAMAALEEAGRALGLKYKVGYEGLMEFAKDLMRRFDNQMLGDTVARVGRDPIRKLAADDRLTGAARLCLSQGVQPINICKGISAALGFHTADDPATQEMRCLIASSGPEAALIRYAGIDKGDPLFSLILSSYRSLHGENACT